MDIGGLISFAPGPGQIIGGIFTAGSLLNNLTYDPPHYVWAAVDLAALGVNLIPAAGGFDRRRRERGRPSHQGGRQGTQSGAGRPCRLCRHESVCWGRHH